MPIFFASIPCPTNASRVFPVAITIDVAADPAVVRFTRNAPKKKAGQTRYPNSSGAFGRAKGISRPQRFSAGA